MIFILISRPWTIQLVDLEETAEDKYARVIDKSTKGKRANQLEIKLQKEIDLLKENLVLSEIYQRKSNLLFNGLEQKNNENVSSVSALRVTFLDLRSCEGEAKSIDLMAVRRLPSD